MWQRQEVSDTRPRGRTEQEHSKVPEQSRGAMALPTRLGGQVKRVVKAIPTAAIQKRVFGLCANDPSAGSPTETLLRLLLPLSDKVH